jgi:asparagine synthase (glutamine-hydrolysing)
MFQGVFKLPAAHVIRFDMTGGTSAWSYWDPLPKTAGRHSSRVEHELALREMLDRSVNEHLVSDVPVGVFLSGGVDSSSILAAMVAASQQQIDSFSVGFKDVPYLNETNQARDIAQHFGARHHEILINEMDMRDSLQKIFWSQDEPLADWVCVPLFHLAGLASSHVKVAMVGEGADELWAGYDGYRDYRDIERGAWSVFQRLPRWLQDFAAKGSRRIASLNWDFATAADFAVRAASDREVFWTGAMTFWETQKHLLLDVEALPAPVSNALPAGLTQPFVGYDTYNVFSPLRQHLRANKCGDDLLGRMIYYELKYRLPELLLMRVDKMTMAHSLEARVPFLDHEIVELAMSTPSDWKTFGGVPKATLKAAVRGRIPDQVIDGPKIGFGAPMAEWLRGDFGREVESAVVNSELFGSGWFRPSVVRQLFARHRLGKRNYAHYLWALYNLTEWHRRWIAASPKSLY